MVTPAEFRHLCPVLVHYAPHGRLRRERGLLTAAQVLDQSADADGRVWAKFYNDAEYQSYALDHWKTHSRFRRGAGEAGSNLLVRDAAEPSMVYALGNNYPLGDGKCLGHPSYSPITVRETQSRRAKTGFGSSTTCSGSSMPPT